VDFCADAGHGLTRQEWATYIPACCTVRPADRIGPVDGLDWDIEGGDLYPAEMTWIGQQLKSSYGSGFAITMTTAPYDTTQASAAQTMYFRGALDCVSPQFYEQGPSTNKAR